MVAIATPEDHPTVLAMTTTTSLAMTTTTNIVALDQERGGMVAVINGNRHWRAGPDHDPALPDLFDPVADLGALPAGGGIVVADGNTWSVRNELSVSQYCWSDARDREAFMDALAARGYAAITVANKLTQSLYQRAGLPQALAVQALADYVHIQVSESRGRPTPPTQAAPGPCGCSAHWPFDSGYPVRPSRGDISSGERQAVVTDFLRMQNSGGYESAFADDVVRIAFESLRRSERDLFQIQVTKPACHSRNRLMAVAVCTHDPATGERRMYGDRPWGSGFIVRRVIGLNGTMRGTGTRSPGNPMRAVLRILGRRAGAKVNRDERAGMDRAVRSLIHALQEHPVLPRPDGN